MCEKKQVTVDAQVRTVKNKLGVGSSARPEGLKPDA